MARPSGTPRATPASGITVSNAANRSAMRVRLPGGSPAIPRATATPNVSRPRGRTKAISLSVVPAKRAAYVSDRLRHATLNAGVARPEHPPRGAKRILRGNFERELSFRRTSFRLPVAEVQYIFAGLA